MQHLTVEERNREYNKSSQSIPMEVHIVDPMDTRNSGKLVIFRQSNQKLKKKI